MSPLGTVTERILDAVHCAPGCELDDLVLSLPELTWNQVFLEVDRLSRTGQVRVTAMGEEMCHPAAEGGDGPHRNEGLVDSPLPSLSCAMLRSSHVGPFQGQGTIWNLSLNGWKLWRCAAARWGNVFLDRQFAESSKHLCGYSDRALGPGPGTRPGNLGG